MQNNPFYPPQPPYAPITPNVQELQRMAYYQEKRRKERNEIIRTGMVLGATIIAFIFMQFAAIAVLAALGLRDNYEASSTFQNAFNVLAVHLAAITVPFALMALLLKSRWQSPLVPTAKLGFGKTLAWICFGMGGCMLASYLANLVIMLFKACGYQLTQTELSKPDSVFACVMIVVSTAIIPAICEEFAFRCCTLSVLKKYGKGFAVVAVSVVFGLIHGNVIQFVFAFLVGLVLGYITIVTDSVVPAMFIHGFNNSLSVVNDIVTYGAGAAKAEKVLTVLYIFWIATAVIACVYLAITKQLRYKPEPKQKEPYALAFGEKLAALLPGLALPFLILIWMTVKTIEKI